MAQTDINLAPGESGIYSISFRPNLVLFWLRSTFLVTNRRIAVKYPNTILGFIPLGFEERSMPMGSIAGVNASLQVKVGRLIFFGILALIFLIMTFQDGFHFWAFLLMVLCLIGAANSVLASLQVMNNGGGSQEATVSILDKEALETFKQRANEYIYSATSAGTSWNQTYNTGNPGFGGPAQIPGQTNVQGSHVYDNGQQQSQWQNPSQGSGNSQYGGPAQGQPGFGQM